VKYGQRKSGRNITHFQFQFGLKDKPQPLERKRISEEDISRHARPGETTGAVVARLSGTSLDKLAKPGETFDQVLKRKKLIEDMKKKLK
jgi:hypothetical protein